MKEWLTKNWVWVLMGTVLVVGGAVGGCLATEKKEKKHPPTITTTALPEGAVGMPYPAITLTASGGKTPYIWSDVNDTLQTYGLSLDPNTGEITGTPIQATPSGGVTVTIKVRDANKKTTQKDLTLVIYPELQITTTTLPDAQNGQTGYSATLTATGGTGTYTWRMVSGSLPPYLEFDSSGLISGDIAPDASANSPYNFTVEVTDGLQTVQADLSITVHTRLQITTTTLPEGEVGVTYSFTFQAAYGAQPYKWYDVNGTLATYGLTLDTNTGVVTGTPTTATDAGGVSVTIQVTDANNITADKTFTLIIWHALQITTDHLAPATEGVPYSLQLQATGGKSTSYQWSLVSGSLPNGLNFSNDGIISGTPDNGTSTGSPYPFTVELTDGIATVQATLWLDVQAASQPLRIMTESLPPAKTDEDYSFTLQAEGGDGNYTWSMVAPSGSAFNLDSSTGELSGKPSNANYEPLLVKVQDGSGNSHTRLLGVRIAAWSREVVKEGWAIIGGSLLYDKKRGCTLLFLPSLDGLKVFWVRGTTVIKEELLCSAFTLSVDAATTTDGIPAVAFSALHPTAANGFAVYYATYNGSAWTLETVDESNGKADDISLAFDDSGTPYIAAYDEDSDYLRYYERSGAVWNVAEFDKGVSDRGEGVRIAVDSGGNLHFAYVHNQMLRYAFYDGSTWSCEDIAIAGDDVESPSLLIYQGKPHIGCTNSDRPQHVWFDGSDWNVEPISGGLFFAAAGVWLAADSQGELYAAYCVMLPYMSVEVAHRVGYANWQTETAIDYFPVAGGTLIVFDDNDNPIVGAGNVLGLVAVATKTAGVWSHTYVSGPSAVGASAASPDGETFYLLAGDWKQAAVVLHTYDGTSWTSTPIMTDVHVIDTAITLDSKNNIHIAFQDWCTGTVYYGFYDGSDWVVEKVALGVWAESPSVAIAIDSNDNPAIVYASNKRILYATKRNNVWETTDPGFSDVNGDGLALFFNSNGNPVILYPQDFGLECVWFDGSTWKNHTYDSGNACDAPAAVTNGNTLYCFYYVWGVGLRLLEMDMNTPANGSTKTALAGVTAEQIAASFDPSTGKLFASYFSQDEMSVFFVSSSGGTWTAEAIEGGVFPTGIVMLCDKNGNNHIFYSATGDIVHARQPQP